MRYEEYLDNLGELSRRDIHNIAENVTYYYGELFGENLLSKIKYLLNLIANDDFPNNFKLDNIKIEVIGEKVCFTNSYKQICFEEDGQLVASPVLYEISAKEFIEKYKEVYKTHNIEDKWKLTTNLTNIHDFDNYYTNEGSLVSLDSDDIKIICKNDNISNNLTSKQLWYAAIENGGKRTESYSSNFRLMIQCGFTPISICKFDINRASTLWLKTNNLDRTTKLSEINIKKLSLPAEDIIFYIYTGSENIVTFDEWIKTVEYSSTYEDAKNKRDIILNKIMEEHNYGI